MYRAEIIANRSVQEEIIGALESAIPEIFYTVIPDVQGRGGADRKLGNVTWPELNFILVAYVDDDVVGAVRDVVSTIKKEFPNEGIKLFLLESQ